MPDSDPKADELKAAIAGLEAQRAVIGDAVVEPAIAALTEQLAQLHPSSSSATTEERKIVTILFVDISGFTALAEKLDPEEVRTVINACFDALVPIVQKYEGTIDKFIGDEIMALFGAPIAHENDPERALRSALEMMDVISSFNRQHGTQLSLHIGVNTGPVVTGAVGSQHRKDYSVMGDAVNLAARLEDASADGEIYVGPSTYRLTEAIFDFEPLPPLTLKGKAQPLALNRLLRLKETPQPTRGIRGLNSALVGRDSEVRQLEGALDNLRRGHGGIVAVVGEAGVGKSRLVSESLARLPADVGRAEGRALSHTTGMSYWMARDVLRGLLGSSEHATADRLELAIRRNLEARPSLRFEEIYPYLATLLQLPMTDEMHERVKFLSTEALQRRILQSFREFVSACASDKPLIIFWEDVHWCDPSSLLVLENLLPVTARFPLLLVLAYRPEEETTRLQSSAQALGPQRFFLIELSPLSRQQSQSLVETLLRIDNFSSSLRDLILDRAEGNPFFIEELLRSLLDAGALRLDGVGLSGVHPVADAQVPETIQGVITARMDRLSPDQKHVLQSAAVIGRTFQHQVLHEISSDQARRTLNGSLRELRRREFIQAGPEGDGSNGLFVFKHAITHDVAYHALLKSRRREIHLNVGVALENLFPQRVSELSPTLAYHFERAESPEKAFRYSKQAAEHAQAVFANGEAAEFYRSAIRQAGFILQIDQNSETTFDVAQIYESLADVLRLSGANDDARSSYGASLDLLPNENRVARSRLHRKIGSTFTLLRRYGAMSDAFDAADTELGVRPVEPLAQWWHEKMQILLERMHLFYWQGMAEEMMKLAERHRKEIEENGTPIQRGKFFQMLSLSLLTGARYVASDEGVRLAELAVSTSEGSADLSETAHVRFAAGMTHLFRGNLREAIEHCEAALSLSERIGELVVQARCLTYLAVAFRRSGDLKRTCAYAERTIVLAAQLGMVEYVAMGKANLAWVAWREQRLADANALGNEALNLWHGMEDPYGVDWQALLPLIAVAVAEQRPDDAIEYARALFAENQHPIPAQLAAAAKSAIEVSGQKTGSATNAKLQRLIEVSQEIGYL